MEVQYGKIRQLEEKIVHLQAEKHNEESAKNKALQEVQDVMRALEEVALSYDQKAEEAAKTTILQSKLDDAELKSDKLSNELQLSAADLDQYRNQVADLTKSIGNELLGNRFDALEAEGAAWEDILAQVRLNFLQQQSRLKDYENNDQYRVETDRVVRARIDLRGVEEQVHNELDVLRTLRHAFLASITRKLGHTKKNDLSDIIDGHHPQKMKFLEANLESLTSAHKALVRENYELKSQTPRLEARLTATMNRCKKLESAVRDQKEQIRSLQAQISTGQSKARVVKPIYGGKK